jgi:hypothetical protein
MADEQPSLRELRNLIERNHADVREDYLDLKTQVARDMSSVLGQMQQFVLREVFEAKETSMLQRIASLEEAAKTARGQVRGAVMAAAGSVVATIITAIILSVILGGKP